MTDNVILDALQKFLQENVACNVNLQKPTEDSSTYELINPSVHIGWIPPTLPEGMIMKIEEQVQDIPCIVVGMDEGEDDGNDAELNIRLSFVVYCNGIYKDGKLYPNFKGYIDLVNFIVLARRKLAQASVIEGVTALRAPYKWGMYKDQPYPYWYGWLTFQASCAVMEQMSTIEKQYE
jgi:hypothetical protein